MNHRSRLTAACLTLATLAAAGSAEANVVDYNSTNFYSNGQLYLNNGQLLSVGDTGTITGFDKFSFTEWNAYIPAFSKIDFTLNQISTSNIGLGANVKYYTSNNVYYEVQKGTGTFSVGFDYNIAAFNGIVIPNGATLITAFANVGGNSGTVEVDNYSQFDATTYLIMQDFNSIGANALATYSVSSVNAVPLPASLPMFAAVLMGLFGFSRFRKQRGFALAA